MKYFVYYTDGYFDNGGVGLEEFENKSQVANFIEKRILQNKSNLSDYIIIEGKSLRSQIVEVVSKVEIK